MIDKKYRPFKDSEELKDFWNKNYSAGIARPAFTNPSIWVRDKIHKSENQINVFSNTDCVFI